MRATFGFRRLFGASAGLKVNLFANYLGQGYTAVANIAFIPLYIHYLGVESYGLIGVFAIILSAANLLDGGLTPTLNRELAKFCSGAHTAEYGRDLLRTVNRICAIGFIGICLLAMVLAPVLASYWIGTRTLTWEAVAQSLFLMMVVAALRVIEGVQRGALLGVNRHVLLNLLAIVTVTLRAGGVILPLAFITATPQMFFGWQVAISALSVLAFATSVYASIPGISRKARFDWAIVWRLRGFAGGVFGATVLAVVLTQADKILLVNLVSLRAFSAYALAAAVAGGLYQLVAPVSQSYYPLLTRQLAKGDLGLAASYQEGAQIVAATVGPPAAILIFFAEPVLALWTGNPALANETAPILSLLALGTLCHCAMYMPYMLQLAAGWSELAMRMNLLLVLLVFPTLMFIVPRAGMIGAAATWVGLNALALITTIQIMHRRLLPAEMGYWYRNGLLLPIGAALVTAGLSRLAYPGSASTDVRILALATACGVTLVAGCFAAPVLRRRLSALLVRQARA